MAKTPCSHCRVLWFHPWWGTRSHKLQLKILLAAAKTRCSQIKIKQLFSKCVQWSLDERGVGLEVGELVQFRVSTFSSMGAILYTCKTQELHLR